MSLKTALLAAAALAMCSVNAFAEILPAKGSVTVPISGGQVRPAEKDQAILKAQQNALDRYIAENNPAKQRIYNEARGSIMDHLKDYILGVTILAENSDSKAKTYTVSIRADLNTNALENRLSDSAGQTAARADGRDILMVFVSRSPTSVQKFDDRVYKRVDTQSGESCASKESVKTHEGEKVRRRSVSTTGTAEANVSVDCKTSDSVETGGSTTTKADKVSWAISEAADFDQEMTGAMAASGFNLVPAEYVEKLNLKAVRADYGRGDDLDPQTLRSLVAAAKASGLPYVVLGTLTSDLPSKDPVTGNSRALVTVNAKLLDVTGAFPRPVAAIGPVQYSGLGPSDSVAKTQATSSAAKDVAKTLMDRLAVKGVR